MTKRGIWCPSGELGNSSKAIRIYGEKYDKQANIVKKNFTKVELYDENDKISRNIEILMTIALWEFF